MGQTVPVFTTSMPPLSFISVLSLFNLKGESSRYLNLHCLILMIYFFSNCLAIDLLNSFIPETVTFANYLTGAIILFYFFFGDIMSGVSLALVISF